MPSLFHQLSFTSRQNLAVLPVLPLLQLTLAAVLASGSTFAAASPVEYSGRAIHPFISASGCPLGGLSGAGNNCNRIALDSADSQASLDIAAHTIRFSNPLEYTTKTVVGDVLLQGSAESDSGKRVPVSFHLVLSKKGKKWSINRHAHAPLKGSFSKITMDAYTVEVSNPDGSKETLLAPEGVAETLTHPALLTRAANELVQVSDNRKPGARDADITIAVGASKLSKPVMRARFHTNASDRGGFDSLLQQGTWAFDLEALTGKIPDSVAQRELFLYGLDQQALLEPLLERGFRKNETLTVGAVNGRGYLRYGGREQDFPGADAAARAFLQQSFIGLILGWHQLGEAASVR